MLRTSLIRNGCSVKSIDAHNRQRSKGGPIYKATKKRRINLIGLQERSRFNDVCYRLSSVINHKLKASDLYILLTNEIILNQHESSQMLITSPERTDNFHIGCQNTFPSSWSSRCHGTQPSIAKHVIKTKHTINPTSSFKTLLHNTDREILPFSEAMAILIM